MKRFARILTISLFLLGGTAPTALPLTFDDPPECDPRDPKCKPPTPPVVELTRAS